MPHTPVTLQQLCTIMYRNEMYFGKTMAAKIVGGRTRLEKLVGEGKIRAEKRANVQNGKWMCNAGDVIYYAKDKLNNKQR